MLDLGFPHDLTNGKTHWVFDGDFALSLILFQPFNPMIVIAVV